MGEKDCTKCAWFIWWGCPVSRSECANEVMCGARYCAGWAWAPLAEFVYYRGVMDAARRGWE